MLLRRCLVAATAAVACAAFVPQPANAEPPVGRYIVVLEDEHDPGSVAQEHARRHGLRPGHLYRHALRGYAAFMSEQAAARVADDPRVREVHPDGRVSVDWQDIPRNINRVHAPATSDWSMPLLTIDRVDDQRVDADIAVIDTGVDASHPDLNVVGGVDCVYPNSCVEVVPTDPNGHGTHVSGTAAAIDNDEFVVGVAPGVRIWSVRVLDADGAGYDSDVLAGVDWVTAGAHIIDVANMSLGRLSGLTSDLGWQLALHESVERGITYAVAAGNESRDVAFYLPAKHPEVITVSAMADCDGLDGARASSCGGERDDTRWSRSNYGAGVDLTAPGFLIKSTFPIDHPEFTGGVVWGTGTSMAAPHVAGAAALLTSQPEFRGDPKLVQLTLASNGNLGWTDTSLDGVREPLLEVTAPVFAPRTVAGGTGTENALPMASFTYRCRGTSCSFDATRSTDTDGTVERYVWSLGDGAGADLAVPELTHEYSPSSSPQEFVVTLHVVDDRGASSQAVSSTIVCKRRSNGPFKCS